MEMIMDAKPIARKYFTPGVVILCAVALAGLASLAVRFMFGLGSITHLDNQHPWGIWIGIDVAAGVALAAGGFTTAALSHIFHRHEYSVLTRPALLTAMLGYTFVALGVTVDVGRYYSIWHPLVMWNGTSVLFEVGMCVMIYTGVLYIEFLPIITKKYIGNVHLKGPLAGLNTPLDTFLRMLDKGLNRMMFVFIILGVVLSCLHQSSLGTLVIIAGSKIHPLWQTPVLPLMFLFSAISVGFPMVMLESLIASRSFGLKPEMDVLSKLAVMIVPLLGVVLSIKLIDMVTRGTFVHLTRLTPESVMFLAEMILGVALPLVLLSFKSVRKSPCGLFLSSLLVIAGIVINRINVFLVGYHPPYATTTYFPSFGEILVTLGFISMEVLLYRLIVKHFPFISQPQ
ncbi:MAG: NrfD/PsrC family molybdoenzyme membrane anchor subunit [bacterium]